jgi:hypothetical protein
VPAQTFSLCAFAPLRETYRIQDLTQRRKVAEKYKENFFRVLSSVSRLTSLHSITYAQTNITTRQNIR